MITIVMRETPAHHLPPSPRPGSHRTGLILMLMAHQREHPQTLRLRISPSVHFPDSKVHLMYEQVGVSDPAPRLRNPVVRVVSMETAEAREVVEVPDLSTGLYLLCAELRAPRGLPRVLQSTCFTARVHTSTSQAEQESSSGRWRRSPGGSGPGT